jgi:hypothetical protein
MLQKVREMLGLLVLLILPVLILICGAAAGVANVWFYLISISWFGLGLIIYASIEDV